MTDLISYREMQQGEEQAVCDLVKGVFDEYVAPDYGQDGIDEFFRFANVSAMRERMKSGGLVLVAQRGDELLGVIEFSPPNIIAMLFVTVRRKGVATALLKHAVEKIKTENPELKQLIVHSSPYALPIYEKMGFKVTGKKITENGIIYIPMKLSLTDTNT